MTKNTGGFYFEKPDSEGKINQRHQNDGETGGFYFETPVDSRAGKSAGITKILRLQLDGGFYFEAVLTDPLWLYSYYPLYPPVEDMNMDYEKFQSYGQMPLTPDVLVVPSELRYFIKVRTPLLVPLQRPTCLLPLNRPSKPPPQGRFHYISSFPSLPFLLLTIPSFNYLFQFFSYLFYFIFYLYTCFVNYFIVFTL